MTNRTKQKLLRENQSLRLQLKAANKEVNTVRGSRAYRAARLAGHAKNQLSQSPLAFTKKVIKRLINGGSSAKLSGLGDNLIGLDDLQAQYKQWIAFNEPDLIELEQQRLEDSKFAKRPLISIITPVFNPPEQVFRDLIESVTAQTYTNFELCLGNFGDDPIIEKVIKEYAAKDTRIKSYKFSENKGIAENSNMILNKVRGEYIALLDHDDTLSPDALFENAKLLNQGDYDFIYSDKDKIDEAGNRFDPFFKPGWSPEIMLNANYLTHLNVMKTYVVKKVGGWDPSTDGAQDWDLFLKVTEASENIGHIQKVLYHWRVIATSTAMSIETKPYALKGQRNAVDKYLGKLKVPAKSYHSGAELLLEWPARGNTVDVVVRATNPFRLRQFITGLTERNQNKNVKFIIFHDFEIGENTIGTTTKDILLIKFSDGKLLHAIQSYLSEHTAKDVLIFNDGLLFEFSQQNLDNLFGWLSIPGVVGISPRVNNTRGRVLDCGALFTDKGVKPIFQRAVSYHQAAMGNIEWIRNLISPSSLILATQREDLKKAIEILSDHTEGISNEILVSAISLAMSKKGRLVLNTKVTAVTAPKTHIDVNDIYEATSDIATALRIEHDPYMNINLSADDPMRLVSIQQEASGVVTQANLPTNYTTEATAHALSRDLSIDDIEKNKDLIKKLHAKPLSNIESALFILPGFNAIYAGLNNIFSYANFLQQQDIIIYFAILASEDDLDDIKHIIGNKFPLLGQKAQVLALDAENVDTLPPSDIAICTQWATAYCLVKYNKTKRKCYFIQDKEASFYAKGTISALAENTYKFGFYALANTPGLLEWYSHEHSGKGMVIKSTLDLSSYAPASKKPLKKPFRVLFYGRPNEPRNAFELGVAALVRLKKKYKTDVEIYSAGSEWDPIDYGLDTVLTNMGKVSYDKLPAFYRSMDAGLMFMFSGHPGVVASELMASGCPVVVNQYDDKTWNELYEHEQDSLVSYPTATAVMQNIDRLLTDEFLRETITNNALIKIKDFYGDYESSCERSLVVLKKSL